MRKDFHSKSLAIICFCFSLGLMFNVNAQDVNSMTKEERDAYFEKLRQASAADHKKMMELLGITTLRPGANGNDPTAANAANYDEAKANPYPTLPDALVLKNGKKVTSSKVWWSK